MSERPEYLFPAVTNFSASNFVAPIVFAGLTALSLLVKTTRSTSESMAASTTFCRSTTFVLTASKGLYSEGRRVSSPQHEQRHRFPQLPVEVGLRPEYRQRDIDTARRRILFELLRGSAHDYREF
jgi:hypothetical protein